MPKVPLLGFIKIYALTRLSGEFSEIAEKLYRATVITPLR